MNLREYPSSAQRRTLIWNVRPGEVFERPNAGVPEKAYRYLKLREELFVNCFTMSIRSIHVRGDGEVVTVIGSMG